MFLLDWYREWLDIRYTARERKTLVVKDEIVCQSCETLKHQLEVSNYEKERLLNRLLEKPEKVEERTVAPEPSTNVRPRAIPWVVRKQILEREDREKAAKLRQAPKPDSEIATESVAELEKELDVAEQTREGQTTAEKAG